MDKLDRLGWAAGISFTAFGVRIGTRVSSAELLDPLIATLPAGWKPALSNTVDRLYSLIAGGPGPRAHVRRLHLLFGNTQRLARTGNMEELLEAMESDLGLYLAMMARHRLFVHAGVIGWKEQAILIPGRSFSGKSTLVKEFLQAGASYYSDEFAVLDEEGRVYPFPRPLSIRTRAQEKQVRVRVEELGAKSGTAPLRVGLVLLTQFQSNAQWRPRVLSHGQGVLGLLANTPAARTHPERSLKILAASLGQAKVLYGKRGEAGETVQSILGRLEN
jgi:hypothetical protein